MSDPERLGGKLLEAGRRDRLEDDRVKRVRDGLVAAGAFSTPAGGMLKGWASSTPAKLGAAIVLVGAGALGIRWAMKPPSKQSEVTITIAPPTPMPSVVPSPEPMETVSATPIVSTVLPSSKTQPSQIQRAPAPTTTSPREGLMLLQARQTLENDPQRALELVRQHEREFPNSQLEPERALLRKQATDRGAH